MIFVVLGTQHNSFERLLQEIEKLIKNKVIVDKVIVQNGYTKYNSNYMEMYDYISKEKFDELLDESDLVITHGGVSTIVAAIKKGKKVIAVPRLKEYNEHVNNHQKQIIETFSQQELIIGINEVSELEDALNKVSTFKVKLLESNTDNIINIIENFINKI